MTAQIDSTIDPEIEGILRYPRDKAFKDLSDRAAYMFITGAYPSHLRGDANRWLGLISRSGCSPSTLCSLGPLRVAQPIADRLGLEFHPMVLKVREMLEEGYQIVLSRESSHRRPYGKIFLYKNRDRITVQVDGSILYAW
jgi:hypothetical protein